MIQFTKEEKETIGLLIKQERLFALYKMPEEETVQFRMQSKGTPELLYDLSHLNDKRGFVVAPFHICKENPAVLFEPDIFSLPALDKVRSTSDGAGCFREMDGSDFSVDTAFQNYKSNFGAFLEKLNEGGTQKLVLSRTANFHLGHFSVADVYEQACNAYPNAYVYLVYTPQTGLWMGGTPEMLLRGQKGEWNTVALAGTQSFHEGELLWDDKNREEQAVVERYVRKQLQDFGVTPNVIGPTNIKAGRLVHLVSFFDFTLEDTHHLGDLLKKLHPTPAVCGLPKETAYNFILQTEQHNRKYYSGFIGELDYEGKTDLFVNLRCMELFSDGYRLYAGGGIMPNSKLDEEWQETRNKMQTMQSVLEL